MFSDFSVMAITTLFLDIGGVLLTNGWDGPTRALAAKTFGLDLKELDDRHHLTFETFEEGRLTLTEYLDRIVFYKKRPFTRNQFKKFMFDQSKPYPEMLELIRHLKTKYGLKIIVLSNECRELNAYRIKKFKITAFVDAFVSSCYVHMRKPDKGIYQLALDISQVPVEKILYIDDRQMFIDVAKSFKINTLHHVDYTTTIKKLTTFGLS